MPKARRKRSRLTNNFYLDEFAVSKRYPELASKITFDALENHKCFFLAKLLLQPVRDIFRNSMTITSGKRSRELNTKIDGSKTSQHVLCEAVDWVFSDPVNNAMLLFQVFEFIITKLSHNWHQVILYISDDYKAQFIHVSLPSQVISKKARAMMHFKGKFLLWDEYTTKEFYTKLSGI